MCDKKAVLLLGNHAVQRVIAYHCITILRYQCFIHWIKK